MVVWRCAISGCLEVTAVPCGWFVRGVGAAQQPQRAAPHTGVPEIGATLCGCYVGAVGGAQGQLNTAGQTSTGGEPIAMAGIVLGTCSCIPNWPADHVL